ncbi:hypothetical protein F2P81_019585 [Scophthalmus maximus]|uniref:Uncharacterized protein n=1 Tax=Scophthalmus maximus TaxID=52904 RepID=A0A6A4S8F5_SCOMX|nr:hypothetical protein F2P81_019585 [Scophthalmus maximus]
MLHHRGEVSVELPSATATVKKCHILDGPRQMHRKDLPGSDTHFIQGDCSSSPGCGFACRAQRLTTPSLAVFLKRRERRSHDIRLAFGAPRCPHINSRPKAGGGEPAQKKNTNNNENLDACTKDSVSLLLGAVADLDLLRSALTVDAPDECVLQLDYTKKKATVKGGESEQP